MNNATKNINGRCEFQPYGKTPRLEHLHCTITEKIDGTNGQIIVQKDGTVQACSRNRVLVTIVPDPEEVGCGASAEWEKPGKGQDNFGFGAWAVEHYEELKRLGPGSHYGEWCGDGIGRRYDMDKKVFVLFDTDRYERSHAGGLPAGIQLAPVLYRGPFTDDALQACRKCLEAGGSMFAPGFLRPEGFIVRVLGRVLKVVMDKIALAFADNTYYNK